MDSKNNDVGPALEGVEFLPARERWDPTSYAVASYLARYRDLTLRAYRQDMLAFLRWCAERQLAPLQAQRPHLELPPDRERPVLGVGVAHESLADLDHQRPDLIAGPPR